MADPINNLDMPRFWCVSCRTLKPLMGRRFAVPGNRNGGFNCAECAPVPVVAVEAMPVRKPKPKREAKARENLLMTDEQVLECRALHEFDGIPGAALAEMYGTSREYMSRLLTYVARSRLIPKRAA